MTDNGAGENERLRAEVAELQDERRARASRRGKWKRFALIALAVFVVLGVIGAVFGEDEPPVPEVASPLDACEQFWALSQRAVAERLSDDVIDPEMRALAKGVAVVDPIQASNLEDAADADNAAESSDMFLVIIRRCVGVHDWPPPTQEELEQLIESSR